ncbi:nuclear transport factor 2 family protein [uncultured Thiothrix sp.]|uniref:nuclear transport factor 2 family protein n=1 Tax=uncultured Thiothrix sp. TaxID=223185 RepID=UPI0026158B2D|nr:nuclear transport factor 2 family protein [uncultured Thiothrix sp.]
MSAALDDFVRVYQQLGKDNLVSLAEAYSPDVIFQDPWHKLQGLAALQAYFANLYTNLSYCRFTIHQVQENTTDANAFVLWQMDYAHPRLNSGNNIQVDGVSHLQFAEKVTYQRDYADMGQMLYEHVPLLGAAIRFLKRRATA